MKRIDARRTASTLLALAIAAFFLWVFFGSDTSANTEEQVKRSYTKQEVDEICAEYERRIDEMRMDFEDELIRQQETWGQDAYEYGYDDGYSDAIYDYEDWLLDGGWDTEFDDHLWTALDAFWSGDTSNLSDFESILYDEIVEAYHDR